jgi:hypothetical protein
MGVIWILRGLVFFCPLGLFVWFFAHRRSFSATIEKVNSWQGPNGLLVINKPDEPSVGRNVKEWMEATWSEASPDWRLFFAQVGADLDRGIYFFQDYWFWMGLAVLCLIVLIILLLSKSYR